MSIIGSIMRTPWSLAGLLAIFLCLLPATSTADRTGGDAVRLMVFGDSLAAGYGLPQEEAFPMRLEAALRRAGHQVTVINAGVSGDTSAGGLARLDWALHDRPDLVIVELGGNDALRGLDPEQTCANLDAILSRFKTEGVAVLLAGMRAPRNLGHDYYSKFDRIYSALAAKHDVPLYPFFLDGVATDPALNQADGIHPNARGVAVIVERILPSVRALLDML